MATSGKKLDAPTRRQIERLLVVRCSRRRIARLCFVSKRTVDKIAREAGLRPCDASGAEGRSAEGPAATCSGTV